MNGTGGERERELLGNFGWRGWGSFRGGGAVVNLAGIMNR